MKNKYMWNLNYCRTSALQSKHFFKLKWIALIRPSVYCWVSGHPIFDQVRVDDLRELPSPKAIIGQKHAFLTPYVSIFFWNIWLHLQRLPCFSNWPWKFFYTFKLHHCPDFYPPAMTNQFGVTVRYCGYILFSMSVLVCYICLCFGKECNCYLRSLFILDLAKVIGDWSHHQGIPGTIQGIIFKARQRSVSLLIPQLQADRPVANGLL